MPADPLTSRRALIGGSVATLAVGGLLAGCDLGDLTPGGGPEPGSVEAEVDADTALVEEVRAEVAALAVWAADLARRHRGDRQHWADLGALHRAHAQALAPAEEPTEPAPSAAPPPSPGSEPPQTAAQALRRGRERERAHQDRLVEAALAAGSGSLARLLAAMSAAVAQRLATWPAGPVAGARR